ncbi:hypothetical protein [Sulfurospirillum arcachonense]|uniref:hypothetical protein n=1 Tax=Sulfurospirillum arcachonense TaxID=57666 RepID=UPI0004BCFC48|nr:hypothetical protein [Sulfurospirillum arcachonense]
MNKFLFLFILFFASQSFSVTIFTYMSKEDEKDTRKDYNVALLKLALDKTIPEYGPYKLVPSPKMNYLRADKIALKNNVKNFVYKAAIREDLVSKLGYVPFPVDRGIVGYRVFFVSPKAKEALKKVTTLKELKKFTIVQGIGWLDTQILRHHGFNVFEGSNYKGLFGMVAKNRIDLFPRGANELLNEYKAYKKIKNLDFDRSLILYYPLPRFFFMNKKNKKSLERLQKGISIAYKDGSFVELWNKYYKKSIDFVNLKKRKIIRIDNPYIKNIDSSYKKYIYQP